MRLLAAAALALCCLSRTLFATAVCVAPPSGLVGWWPGDGTAHDIAGGHNGKLLNGATYAPGEVLQAFSFPTSGTAYVKAPDSPSLDPTAEATLDAWVYLNQLPSSAGHIMAIAGKSGVFADLDLLVQTDNKFYFYTGPGGATFVASTTVAQTGQWYHVAGTYKANVEEKIYVNGVLENTTPIAYTRSVNGNPFTIGESFVFTGRYLYGLADEVQLFSRALSLTEIQSLFNAGPSGTCKPAHCGSGDANGDGAVNVSDIFYLINFLFAGGSAPSCPGTGDVNADGVADVADVFYLINALFAGGPAPL